MESINTRDLLHHTKEVRSALAEGKSFRWESRGEVIAVIQPPPSGRGSAKRGWLKRAASAGAKNETDLSVSDLIYEEREEPSGK